MIHNSPCIKRTSFDTLWFAEVFVNEGLFFGHLKKPYSGSRKQLEFFPPKLKKVGWKTHELAKYFIQNEGVFLQIFCKDCPILSKFKPIFKQKSRNSLINPKCCQLELEKCPKNKPAWCLLLLLCFNSVETNKGQWN